MLLRHMPNFRAIGKLFRINLVPLIVCKILCCLIGDWNAPQASMNWSMIYWCHEMLHSKSFPRISHSYLCLMFKKTLLRSYLIFADTYTCTLYGFQQSSPLIFTYIHLLWYFTIKYLYISFIFIHVFSNSSTCNHWMPNIPVLIQMFTFHST